MNMKTILRRALGLALIIACLAAATGCVRITVSPAYVELSDNYTTLSATPDANTVYRIEVDNMSFQGANDAIVRINYSDTPSVEATVSEDLLGYGFGITVSNGVIRIAPSRHLELRTNRFELTINARFDEIELSGGYDVAIDAAGAEKFELEVAGAASGSIENLSVEEFSAEISGAGMLSLFGTAKNASIGISGAGNIEGAGFLAASLNARISGAGDMLVCVSDALEAKISGMGRIEYYGTPTVTQSVSGFGSVEQKSAAMPGE